jgi:hypothetical protein
VSKIKTVQTIGNAIRAALTAQDSSTRDAVATRITTWCSISTENELHDKVNEERLNEALAIAFPDAKHKSRKSEAKTILVTAPLHAKIHRVVADFAKAHDDRNYQVDYLTVAAAWKKDPKANVVALLKKRAGRKGSQGSPFSSLAKTLKSVLENYDLSRGERDTLAAALDVVAEYTA